MGKYRCRITLESLDTAPATSAPRALRFDFGNHDDILENKENALLTSLKPHFVAFMRELKKGTPGKTG